MVMDELKEIDGGLYPFIKAYTHFVKKPEREIVGREKETRLILSAFCRPELSNVLLLGDAGSGKGNRLSEWIAVNDERGYIRFGDLVVGDQVFDENGYAVTVTGIFPQGKKKIYRVHFNDGTYIDCNDEHLWNVRNYNKHLKGIDEYETLELKELMKYPQGYKKSPNGGFGNHSFKDTKKAYWFIPINKPVFRNSVDLPIDPYVVGVFLGDGSYSDRAFTISSNDEFVIKKVAEKIGAVGYEKQKRTCSWNFIRPNATKGLKFIQTHEILSKFGLSGVFDCKSVDKFIPDLYLCGSIEQRMELLHGLMDTDGTVSDSYRLRLSFSTNSKHLMETFRELLWSLGYRNTMTPNDRKDRLNREYVVRIKLPVNRKHEVFSLPRQLEKIDKHKDHKRQFERVYDDLGIVEIEDLGFKEDINCIMVNGESHLYQVGKEHIVTHNTALLQSASMKDPKRLYLEVDLARMLTELSNENEMAARLKTLFDEAAAFGKNEGKELVLFIDEFHQIVQLSAAGVEALKPLLADSGTRGIRVVVATTYEEFNQYVSSNQALVERLMRINIRQPDKKMTIEILKGMAKRYGVEDQFINDNMFELIYEFTQRYIPSSSQPRKSILVLDAMVGWYNSERIPMNMKLLADVLYDTQGVDVAFKVDATKIKEALDKRVFSQDYATSAVAKRLQLCVADLNNKTRPQSSFLMTGSSGVGKTELSKALAELLFSDNRALTRMDMTEYALSESLERFREELTRRVWARPNCIVLLDEVEKACAPVTRILLQVLDDGRLSDRNGREVSFLNSYIIMTTNAGSEIYRNISHYSSDDTGSGEHMREYDALIRRSITETTGGNRFPPELLGRVDVIVPFQPLSEATIYKIIHNKLEDLVREVSKKHNVLLQYTRRVLDFVVKDNLSEDSDAGGARRAIATLESEITTKVAQFINENPNVTRIGVDIEGTMINEDKNIRKSRAHAVVKGIRR